MKKAVGALIGLVGVGVFLASCAGSGEGGLTPTARERLYRLAQASLLYCGDSDDALMLPNTWMDGLDPYVTDKVIFRSPRVALPGYGIALNTAVAGKYLNTFPNETTVMLFDSSVLTRNATEGLDTFPHPGRYNGTNVWAYADGTVPGFEPGLEGGNGQIDVSVDRVRRLSLAMHLYANDSDDHFPLANWMDGIAPYVTSSTYFYSPKFTSGSAEYGYAFNSDLIGVTSTSLANPATTPAIFDSIKTNRNAVDTATAVPNPGRYDGQNAIGYADSSVGKVRP